MIFKLDQLPWVKLKLQVCWYVRKLLASNPNPGGVILAQTKVVLVHQTRVCFASIEITATLIETIDMERKISFFIPRPCRAIHSLISPNVHICVRTTSFFHQGYVSDDIKVLIEALR